jgi:hypothetical protein
MTTTRLINQGIGRYRWGSKIENFFRFKELFDNMSASEENAVAKGKTYTRDCLVFLFDCFETLGYRNDFVTNDVNANLVVLNDLDRRNNLVDIDFELHDFVINRKCQSLQRY